MPGVGRFLLGLGLLGEFFGLGVLLGNQIAGPKAFWVGIALLVGGSMSAVLGAAIRRPRAAPPDAPPAVPPPRAASHEPPRPE